MNRPRWLKLRASSEAEVAPLVSSQFPTAFISKLFTKTRKTAWTEGADLRLYNDRARPRNRCTLLITFSSAYRKDIFNLGAGMTFSDPAPVHCKNPLPRALKGASLQHSNTPSLHYTARLNSALQRQAQTSQYAG
jgi:hypothetical protein